MAEYKCSVYLPRINVYLRYVFICSYYFTYPKLRVRKRVIQICFVPWLYFLKVYTKSKEWELLARWSLSFCNETQIYDETDSKLLHLVSYILKMWHVTKWCILCNKIQSLILPSDEFFLFLMVDGTRVKTCTKRSKLHQSI